MKKIEFLIKPGFPKKLEPPKPGSEFIPEWYRKGEMFVNVETQELEILEGDTKSGGMKSCMPFLDAIISGYMLVAIVDIRVTKNEDGVFEFEYVEKDKNGKWIKSDLDWAQVAERHGKIGHTIPRPLGFAENHLVWTSHWGMKVPKGWSVLITHPMNRMDLPFYTLSGILESDRFAANGNIPFFIKDGWTGIIEKGTPYAQLIPIKRSSWMSVINYLNKKDFWIANEARAVDYGFYRSKLWIPKKYRGEK